MDVLFPVRHRGTIIRKKYISEKCSTLSQGEIRCFYSQYTRKYRAYDRKIKIERFSVFVMDIHPPNKYEYLESIRDETLKTIFHLEMIMQKHVYFLVVVVSTRGRRSPRDKTNHVLKQVFGSR